MQPQKTDPAKGFSSVPAPAGSRYSGTEQKRKTANLVIEVKILNRMGLHARPAALIARCAAKFQCAVRLTPAGGMAADAKSILSLLMLGAPCGTVMALEACGQDEAEALAELRQLFDSKFDEE